MSPPKQSRQCGRRSKFGTCHRTRRHRSFHATFIGGTAFWFAWIRTGSPLGYGYFSHGRFQATSVTARQPGGESGG